MCLFEHLLHLGADLRQAAHDEIEVSAFFVCSDYFSRLILKRPERIRFSFILAHNFSQLSCYYYLTIQARLLYNMAWCSEPKAHRHSPLIDPPPKTRSQAILPDAHRIHRGTFSYQLAHKFFFNFLAIIT